MTSLIAGYNVPMDIDKLKQPSKSLTVKDARQWLRQFQEANPSQGQDEQGWVDILNQTRPEDIGGGEGLSEIMLAWIKDNELWEEYGGGYIISMKGVGVILSSDQARKSPAQAWEVARDLILAGEWINQAPADVAPMKVEDILIFGSMTNPDSPDHGDLDGIILLSSKQPGAYELAEKNLKELGVDEVLRPKNSTLPSFRASLKQWLGDIIPFASLDDQVRTVEVLLAHDPGFSCYSLFGRKWSGRELEKTTADEKSHILMDAIDNGQEDKPRLEHVEKMLKQALCDLPEMGRRMEDLARDLRDVEPARYFWWVGLDKPGLGMRRTTLSGNFDVNNENPGRTSPTPRGP